MFEYDSNSKTKKYLQNYMFSIMCASLIKIALLLSYYFIRKFV